MRPFLVAAMACSALAILPREVVAAEVPREDLERIRLAAPGEAPAVPLKPRKLLVFSRAEGYIHDSIPWGAAALRIIGEKTGAYTARVSDDPAMFDRDTLGQFDAVVFNNNAGDPVPDPVRRRNLIQFVRGGRGLAGIHCAAHLDWPEYTEMLGAFSLSHPWNAGSTVTIKLDEAEHPLVRCFGGTRFQHTDEIFKFRENPRGKVRVLLSLDPERTNMSLPGVDPGERDFPLSWVRLWGKGRVFYTALGHQKDVFWRPAILKHYLAGIQFALGDLPADATPSAKRPAGLNRR